jgi:glutathione S-transferase
MVAPQLDFFAKTPEWQELTGDHANLVDWLARMEARPSLKATTWEKVTAMAAAGK